MALNTGIEWTATYNDGTVTPGATWNPIIAYHKETGKRGWFCIHQSEGCRHCYAEKINIRLGNGLAYAAQNLDKVRFALAPKITSPTRWRQPRKIFVDSMFDPFLDPIPFELLDSMFAVMSQSPQHTFLLLTKNPKRMKEYILDPDRPDRIDDAAGQFGWCHANVERCWPLPNLWLGVSTERQKEADERIPELLATPAAMRFISYEPALGPVDLNSSLGGTLWIGGQRGCGATHPGIGTPDCPRQPHHHHDDRCRKGLDWVISGSESGAGARSADPQWYRDIKNQCLAAGVAYFHKQEVVNGRKISTPPIDGVQYVQFPAVSVAQ